MSKHINTHLFFHMKDSSSSNVNKSSGESSSARKPKKSSSLFSGYEIDTNPPLPSETGDYYDYYTNYGIPDVIGPTSPGASPPYYNADDQYNYYDYRHPQAHHQAQHPQAQHPQQQQQDQYYDYYNQGRGGNNAEYRGAYEGNNYNRQSSSGYPEDNYGGEHVNHNHANHHSPRNNVAGSSSGSYRGGPSDSYHLQPPLISPPIQDMKRASPTSPFAHDSFSYRNDPQGLGAISHKLHRITFVEACIFQPPDLQSPVRAPLAPLPSHGPPMPGMAGPPPPGGGRGMPILATGERSPTSTGGTQYYQEWTSKHMRHLCSRFEKPSQQQLLMNVERKSKYPFIILCLPESSSSLSRLNSSSSSTSSGNARTYRREMSQHSAYSLEGLDDEEVAEEEDTWITQKQRDSINSHYLPPPPPPIGQPHVWPEIRYVDGLYTVCAMIARPGSGMPDTEFDESFYLGQDMNPSAFEQASYSGSHQDNAYQQRAGRHISFQNYASGSAPNRPAGYIVSAFATFPGEDSERLEKNWLLWTGARILYKYLPMCVGLRRLIFLKRCPDMYREDMVQSKIKPTIFTGFTYVLLCECFNLKAEVIASVCTTIDQLRARCCGYSALYLTHYSQRAIEEKGHSQQAHPSSSSAPSGSGHHQQQLHHHHHQHQTPRHHRSTDFTDFDKYDNH